jgi:molybdopterin-guanine dinucleotide biosynthesis protein A
MVLDSITPIVLVGGKSRRFGRDKLREPVGSGWLVDRPIAALREAFGGRVVTVGDCDRAVAVRADAHLPDRYPGAGPIGGIVSAIEAFGTDVFVLAGDLPRVTADVVRAVLSGANDSALVVCGGEGQPCVALYRRAGLERLRRQMAASGRLADVFAREEVRAIDVDLRLIANANTPASLRDAGGAFPTE